MNDFLNKPFAVVIARMSLAGEDELYRTRLIAAQADDVFQSLENQRSPLVGGEATGEPYGQGIGIQKVIKNNEIALSYVLLLEQEAPTAKLNHFTA
jgi:hypothetical protein